MHSRIQEKASHFTRPKGIETQDYVFQPLKVLYTPENAKWDHPPDIVNLPTNSEHLDEEEYPTQCQKKSNEPNNKRPITNPSNNKSSVHTFHKISNSAII